MTIWLLWVGGNGRRCRVAVGADMVHFLNFDDEKPLRPRRSGQVHVLDLGSYLLGHLLDTSKAQRLVHVCMHGVMPKTVG